MATKNEQLFNDVQAINEVSKKSIEIAEKAIVLNKAIFDFVRVYNDKTFPALKEMKKCVDILSAKVDKKDKAYVQADKHFKKSLAMFEAVGVALNVAINKIKKGKSKKK